MTEALGAPPSPIVTPASILPRGEVRVRLSLRMSRAEALATLAAARAAGMVPGAYVASLVAGIPALAGGGSSQAHLAALIASNAEMTTVNRRLRQLNRLLREQPWVAGDDCRAAVDRLVQGVRGHLEAATALLADLRPRARGVASNRQLRT